MCDVCPKKFATMKSFQNHRNRHGTANSEFICELCQKTFTKSYRLKNHIENIHSEKLYECDQCLKAFATVKRLKLHTDKHLIEKPSSLPCTICQKVFRSTSNLEKHFVKCEMAMKMPRNYSTTTATMATAYDDALNLTQSMYHRFGGLDGFSGHTTT